jgi:PleD family two-component response regulator
VSEKPVEGGRILVVEDEPHLRIILERQLRDATDAKYDVRSASDGLQALEEVRRDPPELILLDVMMPGMDGYEVCRRLKANPLTSRIPVIFLTAKSSLEERLEGLTVYADDYVTKPWEREELLFRVRNQLRTRRAQLSSNALTGLPGNVLIENELTRRITTQEKFAFLHLDLDNFKAYNDYYGYARGDALIRFTASLLVQAVERAGAEGDFVAHIGGDDFVVITVPDRAGLIAEHVKREFDSSVPGQYDPEDADRGFITVLSNRQGGVKNFGLLSVTILVVTNVGRDIQHSAQVNDIARELKKAGKAIHGSCIVPDRRSDGTLVGPLRDTTRPEPRA